MGFFETNFVDYRFADINVVKNKDKLNLCACHIAVDLVRFIGYKASKIPAFITNSC